MADFTALKTAIQTYIKQNGNEEITGEKLQEILLSVVTTLGDSAINDLVTALANEVAARQNADGTLQQNITNEATARGNADTALGGRIDDEATARANGDTALSNRLGSSITAENTAADQIGAEAEARAAADTALQGLIDGITDNIENGYVYAGIATPSSTPATGKVFYLALTAGTYTNFGSTEVSQGINILKYNGSAWSLDAFIGIDDTPTPNSNNLVKSGGVAEELALGAVYDVSAKNPTAGPNNDGKWGSLSALLSDDNLNTLIPTAVRKGGMSIKFVRTYDNNYVQYRYMGTATTGTPNPFLDVANWQGAISEIKENSKDLVESGAVATALNKVSEISKEEPSDTDDSIVFEDEEGNTVVEISSDGVDAKNLKSNGVDVLTGVDIPLDKLLQEEIEETDDSIVFEDEEGNTVVEISSDGVDAKNLKSNGVDVLTGVDVPLDKLSQEEIEETDENISFTNEEETDIYASINQNGVKAKGFFDMNGKSVFVKKNTSGTLAVEESSLTDGESIEINNTPNTKNYKSLSFHADIVTMGTLTIHHGNGQYYCGKVSVDGTNIYPFDRLAVQQTAIPHGLTFTDFVDIDVDIADDINGAKLNINTNGGQYSCDIPWGGANGKATVENSGGSYTNCFFTFGGRAFLKSVWIFGDSYVDFWQPKLDIMGYKEFLADGYSGRKSAGAYQSLVNALKIGYPSTVVWMLGMNDGDNGSINANYKENIDKVVTLCNSLNINLVVATIPNTPTVTNTYKNAYIRGIEGIRVLDIAKCVGADSAGSSWYSGLLSSDNVHPTSSGATVIAKFMSNELPIIK